MTIQSALTKADQFDIFVIDEADQCFEELVSVIDIQNDRVAGFWDLLRVRSILLTATIGENLEDIMSVAFGLLRDKYMKFDHLLQKGDQNSCMQEVNYIVCNY